MKFDIIIIGAGLAGMTAAVRLAEAGKKVALVSSGRSATLFNSGSFGLLGYGVDHHPVEDMKHALSSLSDEHPYSRIGVEYIQLLAKETSAMMERAGIRINVPGDLKNHYRISPVGLIRPTWLTLDRMLTLDDLNGMESRRLAIVSPVGFLDFYPRFIASSLDKKGYTCDILTVDTPELHKLRTSATEFRAANIARLLRQETLDSFADAVKKAVADSEAKAVILPAVIDMTEPKTLDRFCERVGRRVYFAPTLGVSVPGLSVNAILQKRLVSLGVVIMNGHSVNGAEFVGDELKSITTDKLDGDKLDAETFIFAAGSFFSHGVVALPDAVIEPALGLDTVCPSSRNDWFANDMFDAQPIMRSGVAADQSFHALRKGIPVSNLYVAGSALAGADSVKEESGAGVAMLTALCVADKIIRQN